MAKVHLPKKKKRMDLLNNTDIETIGKENG